MNEYPVAFDPRLEDIHWSDVPGTNRILAVRRADIHAGAWEVIHVPTGRAMSTCGFWTRERALAAAGRFWRELYPFHHAQLATTRIESLPREDAQFRRCLKRNLFMEADVNLEGR